jgi:hypothetical protein
MVFMVVVWAGFGWKTMPSDADINSAALSAISSKSAESWTTSKHHDTSQSTQNPLWVNQVVLSWIEPNPNYVPCDPDDDECFPTSKFWCGNGNLSFENGWVFSLGDPQFGVDGLPQCMGFISYANGWIGTDNQNPSVSLTITSQTTDRVEFYADASDPNGDTLTYTWYLDGSKTGATNPDVFWNNPPQGAHTVRVVVADGNGGTAEDTVSFTIGNAPKRYVIAPGLKDGEGPPLAKIEEVIVDGKEDISQKDKWLYEGTRIKSGPGVEVVVRWDTGAVSRVMPGTEIEVQKVTYTKAPLKVVFTRLFTGIYHFYWPVGHEGAAKYEVATERAVAGIEGTRLTVTHLNGITTIDVQEGEVEVTEIDTGEMSRVTEGQSARFDGSSSGSGSIEAALDTNSNGRLDDSEMTQAITYWILGQTVPGTSETISDTKIKQLVQIWILGTSVGQRVTRLQASAASTALTVDRVAWSAPSMWERRIELSGQNIVFVEVRVFDLQGKLIADAGHGGSHVRLELLTKNGTPFANGVYLYQVAAQSPEGRWWRSNIRKLFVLR